MTNDLESRLIEHQEGLNPEAYTFKRRPVKLQFCETFTEVKEAIEFEKKIKKWSAKKKKALVDANWGKLRELAACRNDTHYKKN